MKWNVPAIICFLLIIPVIAKWQIDSADYGKMLYFSMERKEITKTVKDEIWGKELKVTEYQDGFWFGLFPPSDKPGPAVLLGAIPMSSIFIGLGAVFMFIHFRKKFKANKKQ